MKLLEISGPRDLDQLTREQLHELCEEIRSTLISTVTTTGGHLGPNLGVVELTLALHRVFDSPNDRFVFDTGHQSYVHKLITGRGDRFTTLRQPGGLSGYPSRSESDHDIVENSHASTALSWIDGIADAYQLLGEDRHVVGVIGDGALTGGMAFEALNNIAGKADRRLVIIVNDNERSYAPTIGGLAQHLATLRTTRGYERFLSWGKRTLHKTPVVGRPLFTALHGLKRGIHDMVMPQGLFQDLGLKYIGPVDGHNLEELEHALQRAKEFEGPVLVHCLTKKGKGYVHAENDVADHFHGIASMNPETGLPLAIVDNTWTRTFSDSIVDIGRSDDKVVVMTAAMLAPTGLDVFAQHFPHRTFDVGIAEQHAATSAAGMAFAGMHPVVALYATFLNRAFDQVLMDCSLHNAGVTFVLDRAGITGDDGASHNGVWDLALMNIVPRLEMYAPRDGVALDRQLRKAVATQDRPTVVRFPKGALPPVIPAQAITSDGAEILLQVSKPTVRIISVGAMAAIACEVAHQLNAQGIATEVVDPVLLKPLPESLVQNTEGINLFVVIEDGIKSGGIGDSVRRLAAEHKVFTPIVSAGVGAEFLDHGKRVSLLEQEGLHPAVITKQVIETLQQLPTLSL